jgi:hypothetical protein
MKTVNYKNVVIVAMNNCALISNNKRVVAPVMNCTDNTVASLQAMKSFLEKVPANTELVDEPYQLILGEKSSIKGFATGTHLHYIRTGANAAGKEFTAEQLGLIKEVALLLAERSLNVKVTTDKFISYKDKEGRALIDFAWSTLKAKIKESNATATSRPQRPQTNTSAVDPVAAIGLQIAEAAAQGDMAKVTALTAALTALKTAQAQAPVDNEVDVPEDEDYSELNFVDDVDDAAELTEDEAADLL